MDKYFYSNIRYILFTPNSNAEWLKGIRHVEETISNSDQEAPEQMLVCCTGVVVLLHNAQHRSLMSAKFGQSRSCPKGTSCKEALKQSGFTISWRLRVDSAENSVSRLFSVIALHWNSVRTLHCSSRMH